MSNLWGRIKGKVDHASMRMAHIRKEKDSGPDDTVLSRAMIRFYDPDIPEWLESADHRRSRSPDEDHAHPSITRSSSQSNVRSKTRPSLDFLYNSNNTTESLPARSHTFTSVSNRSQSVTQLQNAHQGRVRLSDKMRNANW